MCRTIHISVLMLTLILLAGISCAPQAPRPEIGIKFKEEVYDFGIIDEGPSIEHEFIFTNIGKQTVEILNVKSTCDCTIVDNWDKIVAPGKKGKIGITFKTSGYQGDVSRTITVTTNIPERQTISLTFNVNVKAPIAIIPQDVFLGEVLPTDVNKPLAGSFEIMNNMSVPVKILEIIVPDAKAKLALTPTTLEPNTKYKIDFTVDPPFTGEQTIRGEFRIKTDNEKKPEIVPTYSYFIPPLLKVFPNVVKIDLDQLKGFVIPYLTTINIKSTMDKPIRILGLKLIGGKGIEYEIVEAERESFYQILITIPLDYVYNKDEKVSFVFRVLNDPKNQQYNIPVQFSKTEM